MTEMPNVQWEILLDRVAYPSNLPLVLEPLLADDTSARFGILAQRFVSMAAPQIPSLDLKLKKDIYFINYK